VEWALNRVSETLKQLKSLACVNLLAMLVSELYWRTRQGPSEFESRQEAQMFVFVSITADDVNHITEFIASELRYGLCPE
jgi:hypothetical protein